MARQFAAAFRACRQGGAIPSSTESLDERDRVYHAPAKDINGSDFVRESGGLSGCHFEVACDAARVACVREFEILLGGDDCFVLNLRFVLEDSQGSYVVFDLLETSQHDFAIVGDGLIVRSDGFI